jgi:acyl carrier protein
MMIDTKEAIRKYISDNILMSDASHAIADDTSFVRRGIIDSTGFLELVTFVEQTWGISVADDEMVPENLDSLNGIDAFIRRKLASNRV